MRCRCLAFDDCPELIVSTAGLAYALPLWLAEANLERIVCGYDSDAPAQLAAESLKADKPHRQTRTAWHQGLERSALPQVTPTLTSAHRGL